MGKEYKTNFQGSNYNFVNLTEQNLITQAIDIYGVDVYFLPKDEYTKDEIDLVFQEISQKKYNNMYHMRMGLDDVTMLQGGGDIFSQFGLDIKDSVTLYVTKKEFYEQLTDDVLDIHKGKTTVEVTGGIKDFDSTRPKIDDIIYLDYWEGKFFKVSHVDRASDNAFKWNKGTIWEITADLYEIDGDDSINVSNTTGEDSDFLDFKEIINKIDDTERDKRAEVTVDTEVTGFDPDVNEIINDNVEKESIDDIRDDESPDPFSIDDW